MQLFWHGYSSIRIEAKTGDSSCTIITDPFENESAIRFPRTVEADAVILSKEDRYLFNLEGINGSPFVISRPGEYEVKSVFVNGIKDPSIAEDGVIYRIFAEGISVAFLGQLKRRPTNDELERLERVDILVLPVGGGDVMDASLAADVIGDIEPRIVVPVYYDLPGIKKSLGTLDTFCKHIGTCQRENMTRLKVQQKDLPADTMMIAVLERA